MFNLILLRMQREWRVMLVLLLSICLVAAFLALGNLYVQAIAGADFDQRVRNAPEYFLSLLLRNEQPLDVETPNIVRESMDEYIGEIRSYSVSSTFSLGLAYTEVGEVIPNGSWYRPYGYYEPERYFTLVEGRFPAAVASSASEVEAIITRSTGTNGLLSLNSVIDMGDIENPSATILIVGIVEPLLPSNHPFWQGQTILDIFLTPIGNNDVRTDISVGVRKEAFDSYLAAVIPAPNYLLQADIARESLSSFVVDDLEASFESMSNQLSQIHPRISIRTWLTTTIEAFREGIAAASGPITLLSFLVLVLMLYNITTTASLILEQQGEEWAMISSRGGSTFQLVLIQFFTVSLLGLVAAVLAPFLAYGILLILSFVGPQAEILEAERLGSINPTAIFLSSVACAISVLVLTIPAFPAARQSLSRLKSGLSRPPLLPAWSRYFLDIIFLGLGIAFLLRLYSLNTDGGLSALWSDPASLIRVISAQGGGNFDDIFNLAAPALILVGASLFWMRVFPFLMRLFGLIFAGGNGLTARLAFWNVERDPAHYAQLVLLLIGTLALGTSSLALSMTREQGAWAAAYDETGADAMLELDARSYEHEFDYSSLPSVNTALPFLLVPTGNERDGAIIGIDYASIDPTSFPELAASLAPLAENSGVELSGIAIPDGSRQLVLDIYSPENELGIVALEMSIILQDSLGVSYIIPLETDAPTIGEFVSYAGQITGGIAPYRMIALQISSTIGDEREFRHELHFDNLRVTNADGEATVLIAFDEDTYGEWSWDATSRFSQSLMSAALTVNTGLKTEGESSLGVFYLMKPNGGDPRPAIMNFHALTMPVLPVIVNQTFANVEGGRSSFRRPLQVGDSMTSRITIPIDELASTYIQPSYQVIAVVEDIPAFPANVPLIIADLSILRRQLNNFETYADDFGITLYYDVNRLWLDLAEREPEAEFIDAVSSLQGYQNLHLAWTRYTEIQREPLANSITGMLFAGFWISLILSLIDFTFYMASTIRRRALSFATLQAIGWRESDLLNLLLVEQIAFISPALFIGVLFGLLLAYLILPFLALVGALNLQVPWASIGLLLLLLVLAFALILRITAIALRRLSLNEVMRFGE
jgi:ABC-type antimicrobial peptide transport system permease subunit